MTEEETMRDILAKLTPAERVVWLDLGRRILSGEVPLDQARAWFERRLAELEERS